MSFHQKVKDYVKTPKSTKAYFSLITEKNFIPATFFGFMKTTVLVILYSSNQNQMHVRSSWSFHLHFVYYFHRAKWTDQQHAIWETPNKIMAWMIEHPELRIWGSKPATLNNPRVTTIYGLLGILIEKKLNSAVRFIAG